MCFSMCDEIVNKFLRWYTHFIGAPSSCSAPCVRNMRTRRVLRAQKRQQQLSETNLWLVDAHKISEFRAKLLLSKFTIAAAVAQSIHVNLLSFFSHSFLSIERIKCEWKYNWLNRTHAMDEDDIKSNFVLISIRASSRSSLMINRKSRHITHIFISHSMHAAQNKWNFASHSQFAVRMQHKNYVHIWILFAAGAVATAEMLTQVLVEWRVKTCIHYPINSHLAIIHQLNGVCTTTNADMLYLFLAHVVMLDFWPFPFSVQHMYIQRTHTTLSHGIWIDEYFTFCSNVITLCAVSLLAVRWWYCEAVQQQKAQRSDYVIYFRGNKSRFARTSAHFHHNFHVPPSH